MKRALLIFLLLISFSGFSQVNIEVLMGPEFNSAKKMTLSDVIGYDDSGYYILQTKFQGIMSSADFVSHFNNEMVLTRSEQIKPEYDGKILDLEFILSIDNKIYLFSSFPNQKLDQKFLFYQTLNKSTLKVNSDLKKITQIEFNNKYNSGTFSYSRSRDKKKLLIFNNLPYEKEEAEKYNLKVFDSNMNELWEKAIVLPYSEKLFEIREFTITNSGDVFILGRLYSDKLKEKRKGNVNYMYKVISYQNKGSEIKEYDVSLDDKFLTDMQIGVSDKGDLICAGFYSKWGTFSIDGTYFIRIDIESKAVKSKSSKEFSVDFLTQYETEKQAEKVEKKVDKGKDYEFFEFGLDDIVLREDGGAYLIGEHFYIQPVTSSYMDANGNWVSRTYFHYNYHDILVVNINPDGSIAWSEKIPKRQVSVNDGGFYSSYAKAVYKDKIFFFFNDHIENLETWKTGKLRNFTAGKNGIVTMVELGSDGSQARQKLYKTKDTEIITRPKVCQQIDKDLMIIYGQKRKTHGFCKVKFKKS